MEDRDVPIRAWLVSCPIEFVSWFWNVILTGLQAGKDLCFDL